MSLINQVLKDLEQRRVDPAVASLPRDVRPLPAEESRLGLRIIAGALLVGLVLAGIWAWQRFGPARPLPAVPGLPVQQVIDAAIPALAENVSAPTAATPPGRLENGESGVVATPAPASSARGDGLPALRLSAELRESPARGGEVRPAAPPARDSKLAATEAQGPPPRLDPQPGQGSSTVPGVAAPGAAPDAAVVVEKHPVAASAQERAERLYRSALAQINLGRADDGLTTLRAALREDPAHIAARQTLVRMYLDSRSWDAAAGVLGDGLERRPEQATWAMLLSRLLVERGDNTAALQILERHEAAGRGSAPYLAGMGAILQRLDRNAEAATRYEQAVHVEPANGRWWLGLATAKEALGHSAESREAYLRAAGSRNLPAELQSFAEGKLK